MRRMAGNLLMGLSIVGMVATALIIVLGLVELLTKRAGSLSEDDQTELTASVLLIGVFIALEVAMFLSGRYLRRTGPGRPAEETVPCSPTRPIPLMVYLAVSLGIGLFASFGSKMVPASKALAFLIGQPQVLTQLIFGGILGLKLVEGAVRQAIIVAANLLYFLVLFYPVYSIATMNRVVEVARFKQMKILLAIFVGVHILMAMVLAMLVKA
ncbi:MAG: hypothetical protein JXM79_24110 [Sedimentisphaerales bacterium]|nr:hypothetical protein [Sedimentisphaerales bacterium]